MAWKRYRTAMARAADSRDILRLKIEEAVAANVSQSEIARTLGIPRQQVHRYLV